MTFLTLLPACQKPVPYHEAPPGVPYVQETEDVCRYLFALCKRLEHDFLAPRSIACLFDVTGGSLDGATCRLVGLLMAAVTIDIAVRARTRPKDGSVAICFGQTGSHWLGSIADHGVFAVRVHPPGVPELIGRLARKLNAELDHRPTEDGAIISFLFASHR